MSSTVHTKVAPAHPVHPTHRGTLPVLRTVASLELGKGLIVLLAACGVLLLVRREDPWDIADSLLKLLHISPDHHFAQVFLDWADSLTEAKIWTVAAVAVSYSVLRFVEAYGLWYARAWAEWIALISGTIYLPFEIYKVVHRQSLFHISLLLVNLAIVLYMVYELKTGESMHHIRDST
ncbi:MAG: DUF2127 domain-containing protein [Terriglobales bacterium]